MEFNNININFSTTEKYHEFADYIHNIDPKDWLEYNQNSPYLRKIVIPIGNGGCNFMLHPGELEDLKRLCIKDLKRSIVTVTQLNIDYSLN